MEPISLDFSIHEVIQELRLDNRSITQKPALLHIVEHKDVTMKDLEMILLKDESTIHQALESLIEKNLVRQEKEDPSVRTSKAKYLPTDLGAFIAIGYLEADYRLYLKHHNDNEDMHSFFKQLQNEEVRKAFFTYYAIYCLRFKLFDVKGNRKMNHHDAANLYLSFAYQVLQEKSYSSATAIQLLELLTVTPEAETVSLILSELDRIIRSLQNLHQGIRDYSKRPKTFEASS